jgi:hypothetical protein
MVEAAVEQSGFDVERAATPAAMCFLDLVGYTVKNIPRPVVLYEALRASES